uniref:DUF4932 domain-containing protein n=1 Tax=uncultured Chloroflexota bacterium TaxID=166587 RepID=H5S8P4_9CHLR|nr:hypothetical protein HGMM_F01E07C02 [uncultured Chloroflexota bacterium]
MFALALLALLSFSLAGSVPFSASTMERIRDFTRAVEFNYLSWIGEAWLVKTSQFSLSMPTFLGRESHYELTAEYFDLVARLERTEAALLQVYANPEIKDKESATENLRRERERLHQRYQLILPFVESILQEQVSEILRQEGLSTLGQPLPPVLYHTANVPLSLVVSPRERIVQIANISLIPDLTLEQQIALEDAVAQRLNVSTLVVPIGGVGVYPTMIMRTTNLPWLLSTIAHEWTHNYLQFRPLGMLYEKSPELRTMNETVASIVGNEIGEKVLTEYYPQLAARPDSDFASAFLAADSFADPSRDPFPIAFALPMLPATPPGQGTLPFDFRAEMHQTRITVDKLLAEGKIQEAEAYMEERRRFFWEHGYPIRKLNQAYFAFYGAYADVPGGPAGEDPVGPAVRALRQRSASLAEFLHRIAWMTSFEELQRAILSSP